MNLVKLVDADKLGGYVRAAAAGGLAELVMQIPALHDVLTADARNALALAIATIAVGLWSHIAKSLSK